MFMPGFLKTSLFMSRYDRMARKMAYEEPVVETITQTALMPHFHV